MSTQKYQGDVSIINADTPQAKEFLAKTIFKKFPKKGLTVAYGEITGHHHTIVAEREADVEYAETEFGFVMKINSGETTVTHQEHKNYTLGKGIYFIGRQDEYDPILEFKQVQD
jgi:hypothetical protein